MSKHNGGIYKSPIRETKGKGTTLVKNTTSIDYNENLTVTDLGCGKIKIDVDTTGNFEGKGFQVNCIGNGVIKNAWLQQEDSNIPLNQVPNVFKFTGRLVALSYENRNENVDVDLLIGIRRYPFTNLNAIDESYKWTIRAARFASRAKQVGGFIVNPGDAMAVYASDAGGDSADVVLTFDFIVTNADDEDLQFNVSGNFNSADFPAVGTITEVLV